MDPVNVYRPNLKSVASPVPEIIAIDVLGEGCEPPILGKRMPQEVGDGAVRKSVSDFLLCLHIVTFPIFIGVSEILLQRATFSHTASIVSLKFPYMFPWK